MTYSTADGTVVRKSSRKGANPNARKNYLIIRRDTHSCGNLLPIPDPWKPATKNITIKQACDWFFKLEKMEGVEVKLVTVEEWATMKEVTIKLQGSLYFVTQLGKSTPFLTRKTAENYAKVLP